MKPYLVAVKPFGVAPPVKIAPRPGRSKLRLFVESDFLNGAEDYLWYSLELAPYGQSLGGVRVKWAYRDGNGSAQPPQVVSASVEIETADAVYLHAPTGGPFNVVVHES